MPASNRGEGASPWPTCPPQAGQACLGHGRASGHDTGGYRPDRAQAGSGRPGFAGSGLARTGGRLHAGLGRPEGSHQGRRHLRAPATGAGAHGGRARGYRARPARARATEARARPARARVIEARPAVRAIAAQDRTGAQLATGALPRPVGHNRHGPARVESGRHEPPKGGWDRPGPRRDGPAASRRERPSDPRERPTDGYSDSGPIPSSMARAATTGRNLWPRTPRAPRSEPPRAGRRVSLPQAGEPFALRPRDARPVAGLLVALTGLLHPLYGEAPSVLLPSAGVVVSPRARAPAAQPGSGASSAATRWRDARRSASFLPPAGARYTRSG